MTSSIPKGPATRRARTLVVWGMAVLGVIGGCTGPAGEDVPFAASAPPAALQVRLRFSDAPGAGVSGPGGEPGQASHAQIVPVSSLTRFIKVTIGDVEDPARIDPPPFRIDPDRSDLQEIVLGGLPPGLNRRTQFDILDAGMQSITDPVVIFLNYIPGRITSNDLSINGSGSPFGITAPLNVLFAEEFEDPLRFLQRFDRCKTNAGPMGLFPRALFGVLHPGNGPSSPEFAESLAKFNLVIPGPRAVAFGLDITLSSMIPSDQVLFGFSDALECASASPGMNLAAGVKVEESAAVSDISLITDGAIATSTSVPGLNHRYVLQVRTLAGSLTALVFVDPPMDQGLMPGTEVISGTFTGPKSVRPSIIGVMADPGGLPGGPPGTFADRMRIVDSPL